MKNVIIALTLSLCAGYASANTAAMMAVIIATSPTTHPTHHNASTDDSSTQEVTRKLEEIRQKKISALVKQAQEDQKVLHKK